MEHLEIAQIHAFLEVVGQRYPDPATLYLLGGSALCLLGSVRPTLDIDYVGNDLRKSALQQVIDQIAQEMQIEVEAVPIEEFVPLPADALARRIHIEQFGAINVYVFDPYTIALSKLDRGFDTDVEDIVFLIRQGMITLEQLAVVAQTALELGKEFALNASAIQDHLQAVRNQI